MGNLKQSLGLALALVLASGCGIKMAQEPGKKPPAAVVQPTSLSGVVYTSDGQLLDLAQVHDSIVLTFSEFYCLKCREEAKEFVAHFAQTGGLPRNARIVTVIIGESANAAGAWKSEMGVPWEVAVDDGGTASFSDDDQLFKQNCPTRETPCTVTYNAQTRQVRRFFRVISVAEAQGETGPWLY